MAKIELINVGKRYKDETVISGLNLTIKDGSFTVLVGPSGCGKSTTLRMIAGLEKQSEGQIWIGDKCVNETQPGLRDVAMVFQNYALYPTMTVRENIEFGLKNRKVPKPERETVIREICEIVGLTPYLDKKPQHLSGGQRQRVALARAMVKKPKVFILDEPLSNLDAKLRNQMRTELIQLHRRLGTTFVYVTHDQVEAMSMGDEIVVMNKGVIQQADSPMKLYNDPDNLFTAQFIGTPAMNMLDYGAVKGLKAETAVKIGYVGFRAEHGLIGAKDRTIGLAIEGEIVTRESLGAEHIYQIRSAAGIFFVKTFLAPMETEDRIQVTVPYERLYYFDLDGNRIRLETPQKASWPKTLATVGGV
ncbi:ABC transporter ATP-binding protein [Paenibacillus sp. GYB003]|uniref:ABC transporter ATP-binding protein n=1 Tax=Paenibacillus sp. GYB003 TaxID=2994392 RepID=UPI002F96B833